LLGGKTNLSTKTRVSAYRHGLTLHFRVKTPLNEGYSVGAEELLMAP
jgi:hypothetical protein